VSGKVLITRTADDAAGVTQAFARIGLEPVLVPLLERKWDVDAVLAAVAAHPSPDVVFVTSGPSAQILATAVPTAWSAARWVAVCPSTQARLVQLGFRVDQVAPETTAASLVQALENVQGALIVYPKADLADPETSEALRARGAVVVDITAYRNVCPDDAEAKLLHALPVSATPIFSGSAAERLAELIPPSRYPELGRIIAIGPTAARVAQRAGLTVYAVAHTHTAAGVVSETARALGLTYP
jgi:uroporphyrinogen-III synthase